MTLEELRALPPDAKAPLRRAARRQLSIATRLVLKPQPVDRRAYLTGYLDYARKALEALS